MDADFFYHSIYDRFIQRQPCACMLLFIVTENLGLWSDTGTQAPLVY